MKEKKTEKQKNKNGFRRPSIFTIILCIIAVFVVIGIIILIKNIIINVKYQYYTDKMYEYGYETFYNNKKTTQTEPVTNEELLRVVLGSIKNTENIDEIYYSENNTMADNEKWYNAATVLEFNTTIKKEDLQNGAKKIDAVIYTTNIVEKLLGKSIEKTTLNITKSKLSNFSDTDIDTISKAITLGLIENKSSSLKDSKLIKGELNKLVITIVEKYSTIYFANQKSSGNNTNVGNIVTDKEKMPKSYNDYPYIVDNIDKEIYDIELKYATPSNKETPKESYKAVGSLYMQIDEIIERYFTGILNIDYNNISYNNFLKSIDSSVIEYLDEEDVKEYVDYVKQNKIKIEGKGAALLPIIYYTGEEYIVRCKINFKVLNSDTNENLLFGDKNVKYGSNEIEMYVDLPMGITINSRSMLVNLACLADKMVLNNNNVIINK